MKTKGVKDCNINKYTQTLKTHFACIIWHSLFCMHLIPLNMNHCIYIYEQCVAGETDKAA